MGCQRSSDSQPQTLEVSRLDTQLILNNAVLEQSNQSAATVWKIKAASIVYSEDKKTANLQGVVANLLHQDEVILQISAKTGKVQDNGNVIILDHEVIASDPRNQSVIKTNAVEWLPQKNLLLIKDNLTGIHPNLQVTAATGKYYTDIEQLEISGKVTATTSEPVIQLNSDRLVWNIPQGNIKSPGTIKVVGYNLDQKIENEIVSDRAEVNLASYTATLNSNVELTSLNPKLQVATESLNWNYQQRRGYTKQPVQIVDRKRNLNFTGNQAEVDLKQQIAKLTNGVNSINAQENSQLYANQLTWKIATADVSAVGNVIYEQNNPSMRLTGEVANGNLKDNNITVTGNGKIQVTSVINN
ncbi:hypothetical protein NIES4102_39230 [Chondrocystis sp. NIES-4102]|nr:hypothetical protein NIES4102_39230 [Chondrocystis sp. NIES-4102]